MQARRQLGVAALAERSAPRAKAALAAALNVRGIATSAFGTNQTSMTYSMNGRVRALI